MGYDNNWGHNDPNLKDNTFSTLLNFMTKNKLVSQYMTPEEIQYIEDNIERDYHGNIKLQLIINDVSSVVAIFKKKVG